MTNIRNNRILQQTLGVQKCPDCFSQLEPGNTLKYCSNCKKCPTLIQQNHFQPMQNFQSQYRQQLQNRPSGLIKIQTYTRDIVCKLNMKLTDHQLQQIVQKVRDIHWKRGGRCKGYREESAAVIYRLFQDQIRMSLYQFCNKTGINRKKFNRMYVLYLAMLRQSNEIINNNEQLKLQNMKYNIYQESDNEQNVKYQQSQSQQNQILIKQQKKCNSDNRQQKLIKKQDDHQQPKYQLSNYQMLSFPNIPQRMSQNFTVQTEHLSIAQNMPLNTNLSQQFKWQQQQQKQNIYKTITVLYDKIFTSSYLQKNMHKQQIIKSIVQKSLEILKYYMESQPINCMKKYFRIPAVIFCVVKNNGYKITMKKYIKEVQTVLNVSITERMIGKLTTIANQNRKIKNEEEDDGSSPTEMEGRQRTPSQV